MLHLPSAGQSVRRRTVGRPTDPPVKDAATRSAAAARPPGARREGALGMAELELTRTPGDGQALRPPRRGDAAAARALRSRGHGRGRREPLAAPEARAARTGGRRHGRDGLAGGEVRAPRPSPRRHPALERPGARPAAASAWRERYALADGDAELATVESKGWGRRQSKVVVEDDATLEAGLLLFAVYVVRGLGEEASSAAATGATAATSGSAATPACRGTSGIRRRAVRSASSSAAG